MATPQHPYYRDVVSGRVFKALTGALAGSEDTQPARFVGLDTYDPTADDPTEAAAQAALAAERGDRSGYQSAVVAMTAPATTDDPTPPPVLVHGLGQAIAFGDAPGIFTRGEPTQVVPGTDEVADGAFVAYTGVAPGASGGAEQQSAQVQADSVEVPSSPAPGA